MAKKMKATVRNGRATASGKVYNANHNTKTETRNQERHIDHSRTDQNINLQFTAEGRVRRCGSFDAKAFELSRYEQLYGEGQEAKNARYIADGHPERCKSVADIYASRRTAPLETILQIGSRDTDIDPKERREMLMGAAAELIANMQNRWGDNIQFLTLSRRCSSFSVNSTPTFLRISLTFSGLKSTIVATEESTPKGTFERVLSPDNIARS